MALFIILRAVFGYLFLVLLVRILGRRPGKQLTPFEFVLIFYLGGLTLTGMVGLEVSLTNAVTQIITVAACHYMLAYLRFRFDGFARVLDGSPLVLLDKNAWRTHTLSRARIQDDDVMDMARQQGIKDLSGIKTAVLETFGQISIVPDEKKPQDKKPEAQGKKGPGKREAETHETENRGSRSQDNSDGARRRKFN